LALITGRLLLSGNSKPFIKRFKIEPANYGREKDKKKEKSRTKQNETKSQKKKKKTKKKGKKRERKG
jgi:hypothetical protein